MEAYLGLDLGAVSTNLVIMDATKRVLGKWYLRTQGDPIGSIKEVMKMASQLLGKIQVKAAGTTGSGRHLAKALIGADVVKNEITAHASAAIHFFPDVRTIIEIGGQDSKIIIVRDGEVVDFAVNTICAAGTGSFLDYQASRMGMTVEELSSLAATSEETVPIGGRCAVFAESDVVERQQRGATRAAIARGLCEALVRNYLSTVGAGKSIEHPVVFQGGVASNAGVRRALEEQLGMEVRLPKHHEVMGAIGAALIAGEEAGNEKSHFRGRRIGEMSLSVKTFICMDCPITCEIAEIYDGSVLMGRWGGRCERWDIRE